jgi:hypothetical protein
MGSRFRKSSSPLPGVRFTISPRGLSTSVGAGLVTNSVGGKPRNRGIESASGTAFATFRAVSRRAVDPVARGGSNAW